MYRPGDRPTLAVIRGAPRTWESLVNAPLNGGRPALPWYPGWDAALKPAQRRAEFGRARLLERAQAHRRRLVARRLRRLAWRAVRNPFPRPRVSQRPAPPQASA